MHVTPYRFGGLEGAWYTPPFPTDGIMRSTWILVLVVPIRVNLLAGWPDTEAMAIGNSRSCFAGTAKSATSSTTTCATYATATCATCGTCATCATGATCATTSATSKCYVRCEGYVRYVRYVHYVRYVLYARRCERATCATRERYDRYARYVCYRCYAHALLRSFPTSCHKLHGRHSLRQCHAGPCQ